MLAVGVVEILAGILAAFKPRIGAYVVAAGLWGVILNLLLIQAISMLRSVISVCHWARWRWPA